MPEGGSKVAFIAFTRHFLSMRNEKILSATGPRKPRAKRRTAGPSTADRRSARSLATLLRDCKVVGSDRPCRLDVGEGEPVELPGAMIEALFEVAEFVARGTPVAVLARDEELTTQQAADLLNVSRQYLVRLLDAGRIPYTMVGAHRRVSRAAILAYRAQRDAVRRTALGKLAAMGQASGQYDLP